MTDKEQATTIIARYMDLLRIKTARNIELEVDNQLCEARAQLQALVVVVEDLTIKTE